MGRIDSTRGGDLGVDRSLNLFFGGIGREHEGVACVLLLLLCDDGAASVVVLVNAGADASLAGVVEVVDLGTRKTRGTCSSPSPTVAVAAAAC